MIAYNLDTITNAKKLVDICDKYKDQLDIDITYGGEIVHGTSILGVISLCGHIVGIEATNGNEQDYENFAKEVKTIR